MYSNEILDKVFKEKEQTDQIWNKENKPIKEVIVIDDGEMFTFGLWKFDGAVFYSQKTKNKKIPYRPYSLVKLDAKLVQAIKEL